MRQEQEDKKDGIVVNIDKKKEKKFMDRFMSGELDLPSLIKRTRVAVLVCVGPFFLSSIWMFYWFNKRKATGRTDLLAKQVLPGTPSERAGPSEAIFLFIFFAISTSASFI